VLEMPINRRKFIQQTSLAAGALLTSSIVKAGDEDKVENLTILHTNDVHSRLESFPNDGSRNAGLGGIAARAELIRQIRSEVDSVLLLDAGDMFQGTPYFNLYKGEAEIKAMNMMNYDAATIGNHDFDAGIENLSTQLGNANFSTIICNYDFKNTPMDGKTVPYKIFQKGNIKVGVLGVGIELRGLVPENLSGKTVYYDPVMKANETADILKQKHKCNMIICLSHLGDKYTDDKVSDEILAKETFDIDLIIGGHTHRFFSDPRKYRNRNAREVIVNQVGWGGINLGRLDYNFHRTGKKNLSQSHTVVIAKKTSN
jgi:5'-nucleotidase